MSESDQTNRAEGKPAIIYHKGCPDGFGAAWAASRSRELNGAQFIAAEPEGPPPQLKDPEVIYIIDVSFTPEDMRNLHDQHGQQNVILLDHHETAEAKLSGMPNCHFDMSKSGAVMAWEHFHPGTPVPELLLFVQDRDLWKWELHDSRAVSAYLHSQRRSFNNWDNIHNVLKRRKTSREKIIAAGQAILEVETRAIRNALSKIQYGKIGGHEVPIVNSQVHRSEIGNALAEQHPDHPFAAVYYDTTHVRNWSLRSTPNGVDVGAVAMKLGGGGHARAAGFKQAMLPPAAP